MRFTALALSGLALVLIACSGEAPTGSVPGGNTPSKSGTKTPAADNDDDTSNTPSTSQTTNPTDPAPAGGDACGAKADMKACFTCCDESAPGGFEAADEAWFTCACAADKCGTACGTSLCSAAGTEPKQGDACDTCLQAQDQACGAAAETACKANANCTKAVACAQTSKCADKPE